MSERKSALSAKKWAALGELIESWAGSDEGSDDLAGLLGDISQKKREEFYQEFKERLRRAFG